jgi:hypothetical protein
MRLETSYGGQASVFQTCFEVVGVSATQLQEACILAPGDADAGVEQTANFSRFACSRDNVLAGCRLVAGGVTETIWYYRDSLQVTAEVLHQTCVDQGGTPLSASGRPVTVVTDAGTD